MLLLAMAEVITTNLSITDSDGDNAFATLNFNLDIMETVPPVMD
jgi:hypothetical protein